MFEIRINTDKKMLEIRINTIFARLQVGDGVAAEPAGRAREAHGAGEGFPEAQAPAPRRRRGDAARAHRRQCRVLDRSAQEQNSSVASLDLLDYSIQPMTKRS